MNLRSMCSSGQIKAIIYRNYCAKGFFSKINIREGNYIWFSRKQANILKNIEFWEKSFCTVVSIYKCFNLTRWTHTSEIHQPALMFNIFKLKHETNISSVVSCVLCWIVYWIWIICEREIKDVILKSISDNARDPFWTG